MAGSGKRLHAPRARGAEARGAAGSFARDVEQGPAGPRVGALFDFDRTLIAGFSAVAFLGGWLASGRMGPPGFARTLAAPARFRAGNIGFSAFTVAVVSSATRYQIEPLAEDLGIEHVLCTELEVRDGAFTGRVVHPACFREGKLVAAQRLASERGIDLTRCYFYTDGDWTASDLPEQIAAVREWFVETLGDAAD